jgi:2-C-methyl-D-erythritol 2,4-cyclodiphosphate synthase
MNSNDSPITRIGLGTDVHRLEPGGPLRIGGVDVPFDKHSAGHSDGDVVLHAVTDALLGALGLPDIGERFPDTDPAYKGADSRGLLKQVVVDVRTRGHAVAQVDLVIHAERPKLSGFKDAVRMCLADLLDLPPDRVGIKAKTGEGLDAVGRGEAIACTCVVGLTAPRQ